MEISKLAKNRKMSLINTIRREAKEIEILLERIIADLTISLDSKAMDWQERDRIDRAIKNLNMTRKVIAAKADRQAAPADC